MSNRRRAMKKTGGWFTSESHLDPDGTCSCKPRRVEYADHNSARCQACSRLVDLPPEVPLPADVPPGATGPIGFACFCGAPPVDLLVRVLS